VPDVQRAGRVRGDELDDDARALAAVAAAVGCACLQHVTDDLAVGVRREMEVDEAGTCDFDARDARIGGQRGDDALGQLARRAPCWLGEQHGDVAGEVAMGRVARAFDRELRRDGLRRHELTRERAQRGA